MKNSRSSYISKKKIKFFSKENKPFFEGVFYGVIIGYIPYIVHMNQWLR